MSRDHRERVTSRPTNLFSPAHVHFPYPLPSVAAQWAAIDQWTAIVNECDDQLTPIFAARLTYLITFACYGAHLHGDERGSVDRDENQPGARIIEPNPRWAGFERHLMRQSVYTLDQPRRDAVLGAIIERCSERGWNLLAAHVRPEHVHLIVDSDSTGERVMNDLKSYASRVLNQRGFDTPDRKRWARHGSTKRLPDRNSVESAIRYVTGKQGDPMAVYVVEGRY